MRDRPAWMNKASVAVLEVLAEAGIALSASVIEYHLQEPFDDPPSRSTVYRALDGLVEHGYVREIEWRPTVFELTEDGEAYLDGGRSAGDSDS